MKDTKLEGGRSSSLISAAKPDQDEKWAWLFNNRADDEACYLSNLDHDRYTLTSVALSLLKLTSSNRASLDDRVTIYVGQDAIPIELPKVFLTKHSKMFQVAFDTDRAAKFAEGATKQMSLPEEDVRDFMFLLRILIHQPQTMDQLYRPHWPYDCEGDDGNYCCDSLVDIISPPVSVAPPMFRLCAMLERLGFELPECVFEVILNEIPPAPRLLVAPTIIDSAMGSSLDNGYVQRYLAKVLTTIIRTALTTFDTYKSVLRQHPQLTLALAEALYTKPEWNPWKWSSDKGRWDYHYQSSNSGEGDGW